MAPRKPKKSEPTPPSIQGVDWNGSLADYKQSTVGNVKPGGTKMPTGNKGPDTGMFAGSGTPLNSSIGMTDTSRKNVTNVIKNLVIQEVGGAALAKGLQAGLKATINTGIPARIGNIIKGEQVIVHGGKVRGLKQIDPRVPYSSNSASAYPAVFGVNPSYRVPARGMPEPTLSRPLNMAQIADDYAAGGSIYVAKVPKNSVLNKNTLGSKPSEATIISTSPAKVVAEISNVGSSAQRMLQKQEQILKAAKRAGAKIPKKK